MSDFCYYILDNTTSSKKGDLEKGARIFEVNTTYPIFRLTEGEGPFYNLKILMENSLIYKKLKVENSRRAHKIIQQNYIVKVAGGCLIPKGTTYKTDFIDALQHSYLGEIKKGKLTGNHFYDQTKIKIIEYLNSDKNGVWAAIIEKKDSNGNFLRKEKNTFFPNNWNQAIALEELNFASKNIEKKQGTENIYQARTLSGINIEIVIVNDKMKTIYPVLEIHK
ncbi:MAG TPA: EndoU domain-containing protein [Flavobacterium sp.]|nr:EndoU domain-containing protein [Flavobacterium sp.]